MSLGAIDFGLIVDSSVIMIENCMRHAWRHSSGRSKARWQSFATRRSRCAKPTMFGELIIAVVYLPILVLQGNRGETVSTDGPDGPVRPGRVVDFVADLDARVGLHRRCPSDSQEKEVWLIRVDQVGLPSARDPRREASLP